jgi:membrane-associated phospholipid phosphatase
MNAIQNENKDWGKWKYAIFIFLALMSIPILFIFDTPIWQAARDLVEPDYLYIPELFTHWGLYPFYFIFAVIWIYAFIKKDRNLKSISLAYLKAQLVFSLVVVRLFKVFLGRARPGYGSEFTFFETSFKYTAFPSGHSADAFVSGIFLFYILKQTKYAGSRFLPLIYAFLIAISRIFVSSHYPSDVAAGMTIGILGAWFFISRSQRHGN